MRRRVLALCCAVVFCLSTGLVLAFHHHDTVIFDKNYNPIGLCKMQCNQGKLVHYIYYNDLDGNGQFSGATEVLFEIDVTYFGR